MRKLEKIFTWSNVILVFEALTLITAIILLFMKQWTSCIPWLACASVFFGWRYAFIKQKEERVKNVQELVAKIVMIMDENKIDGEPKIIVKYTPIQDNNSHIQDEQEVVCNG